VALTTFISQVKIEDQLPKGLDYLVVVVLPDPFREMGARRNSTETQQLGRLNRLESCDVIVYLGQFLKSWLKKN